MNLWDAIQAAARIKRGLGSVYEMCSVELLPHGSEANRAEVTMGEKLLRATGERVFVGLKRTTISRTEWEAQQKEQT